MLVCALLTVCLCQLTCDERPQEFMSSFVKSCKLLTQTSENKLFTHWGKNCHTNFSAQWSVVPKDDLIKIDQWLVWACHLDICLSKCWSTLPRPLETCKSQAKLEISHVEDGNKHRLHCLFLPVLTLLWWIHEVPCYTWPTTTWGPFLSVVVRCLAPRGWGCQNKIRFDRPLPEQIE